MREDGVSRLMVALDVPTREQALDLASATGDCVSFFKVGGRLFTAEGPDLVRELKSAGNGVFLDLKFHDIPNTVAEAAEAATGLGVDFFDIHASGGEEMMKAAVEASKEEASKLDIPAPKILAITVLTSMSSTVDEVLALAERARRAGVDGVVSSAWEAKAVREAMGSDFIIVTPGIRPAWAAKNDQRRVATPEVAIANGADFIVVGRPITKAESPAGAARMILDEMAPAEVPQ
jgi:orotidine-5'-phosphate decarboxylase